MGEEGRQACCMTNCLVWISEKRGYCRVSIIGAVFHVDKRLPGVPLLGMDTCNIAFST